MPDRLDSQTDARLLRLLIDGELAEDDVRRAQALAQGEGPAGEAARRLLETERNLKGATGRVMASELAPASLRWQVARALAAERDAPVADLEEAAGRIEPSRLNQDRARAPAAKGTTWWWPFASPQRANFAAVAAVLALIVGAVLFGIYGRTIDDVPPQRSVDVAGNVAQFVDAQHNECTQSAERRAQQAMWDAVADAEAGMSDLIGSPVRVPDLSALGYEFVGAGQSRMPLEREPSGQLMYRKVVNGRSGAMVSIFVAPMQGCCKGICSGMRAGEWRVAQAACKRRVLYSTDGRLLYFLVCCDERDQADVAKAISLAHASPSR